MSVERDQDDPKTHSLNNSLGDGQEAIIGLVGRMAWFKYPNKHPSELILDCCPPTQPKADTVTADRYAKWDRLQNAMDVQEPPCCLITVNGSKLYDLIRFILYLSKAVNSSYGHLRPFCARQTNKHN